MTRWSKIAVYRTRTARAQLFRPRRPAECGDDARGLNAAGNFEVATGTRCRRTRFGRFWNAVIWWVFVVLAVGPGLPACFARLTFRVPLQSRGDLAISAFIWSMLARIGNRVAHLVLSRLRPIIHRRLATGTSNACAAPPAARPPKSNTAHHPRRLVVARFLLRRHDVGTGAIKRQPSLAEGALFHELFFGAATIFRSQPPVLTIFVPGLFLSFRY